MRVGEKPEVTRAVEAQGLESMKEAGPALLRMTRKIKTEKAYWIWQCRDHEWL